MDNFPLANKIFRPDNIAIMNIHPWTLPSLLSLALIAMIIGACKAVDNWTLSGTCPDDETPVVRFQVAGSISEPPPPEPNPTTLTPVSQASDPLPEFSITLEPISPEDNTTSPKGAIYNVD